MTKEPNGTSAGRLTASLNPLPVAAAKMLACVAGVKRGRGRGDLGAREHVGRAREKGKERLQGRHCFLHFSRSESERENSDRSELIKYQSST